MRSPRVHAPDVSWKQCWMCHAKLLIMHAHSSRVIRGLDDENSIALWSSLVPLASKLLINSKIRLLFGNVQRLNFLLYLAWTILKDTQGAHKNFQTFFIRALLLIVHTWNSSPLWSNLLRLQCTCTIPTTSGRPHGSPLVWACQWPSSQLLSFPLLSHNDSL